jgi:hypothetical protein
MYAATLTCLHIHYSMSKWVHTWPCSIKILNSIHEDALYYYLCQHVKEGSTANTELGKERETLYHLWCRTEKETLSKTQSISQRDSSQSYTQYGAH